LIRSGGRQAPPDRKSYIPVPPRKAELGVVYLTWMALPFSVRPVTGTQRRSLPYPEGSDNANRYLSSRCQFNTQPADLAASGCAARIGRPNAPQCAR